MLTSSKLVYSTLTLPETLVQGDVVNIPITVYNNVNSSVLFQLEITEWRDGNSHANKTESNVHLEGKKFE